MIKAPSATIETLFNEEPARNPLAEFGNRRGIRVVNKYRLMSERPGFG
jgi:hypothetical protein